MGWMTYQGFEKNKICMIGDKSRQEIIERTSGYRHQ